MGTRLGINQSDSIAVRDTAQKETSTVPFTLELLRKSDLPLLLFPSIFVVLFLFIEIGKLERYYT